MLKLKNIQKSFGDVRVLNGAVITIVAIIATIVGCGGNGNPGGGDNRFTTFTLTTSAEPAIGGTVSRDPHTTNYQNGTAVTLTVTPAAGYRFVGWSDESIPAISPTTITIVRNTALIAKFEPIPIDRHTLTVNANPAIGGTVSREPDAASYAHGTEVTVTAAPAEGYRFINWSGASTSETQEVTVTVNNNMTLTANFELIGANVHALTINANPAIGGTVSREPDAASYTHGTEVTVTATPAEGYTFINWSGAATSTNAEVRVTMNANLTLTANFLQIPGNHHTLVTQITPDNGGIIHINNALSTEITTHGHGVSVNISAIADPGFRFVNWTMTSGTAVFGNANSENTTITLTSNTIIMANFVRTYVLRIDRDPIVGGTVTPASELNHDVNIPISITAATASGYRFVNWTVTSGTATFGNADSENTTITLSSDATITANFQRIFTLTITQNPTGGGTVTPASGQSHDANTAVSITAAAATGYIGYRFVNWTVTSGTAAIADVGNAATTIILSSNATITANFQRTFTLTITQNPIGGGTFTPSSGQSHDANTPISITATPASGYEFISWTVTSASGTATFANANDAATTVTLSSNATIRANFRQPIITGSLIDLRDNQTYRTVTIDTQTWMAENLNWAGEDGNLGACYANSASNCDTYGRLYDWHTVMAGSPSSSSSPSGVRGICPEGWHVPSNAEWTTLVNFVSTNGTGANAGTRLKSTTGWNSGVLATDDFGFSALPGGGGDGSGYFNNVGSYGYWWSATEIDASLAWYRDMSSGLSNVFRDSDLKSFLFSLRCLEDYAAP
jgi:uncharacterized protein (TIGR02145 family)/uncharacterized repeat protein (TIGR02543 family)